MEKTFVIIFLFFVVLVGIYVLFLRKSRENLLHQVTCLRGEQEAQSQRLQDALNGLETVSELEDKIEI